LGDVTLTEVDDMDLSVSPVQDRFVARVAGVDLSQPLEDDCFARIHHAFCEHSVLVFSDQQLSNEQHIAFSRRFGELEIHTATHWLLPDFPEILVLSNRGEKGTKPIIKGGAYWHSDMTYKANPPLGPTRHWTTRRRRTSRDSKPFIATAIAIRKWPERTRIGRH
jgi:taurine dioxygenase